MLTHSGQVLEGLKVEKCILQKSENVHQPALPRVCQEDIKAYEFCLSIYLNGDQKITHGAFFWSDQTGRTKQPNLSEYSPIQERFAQPPKERQTVVLKLEVLPFHCSK